ncbi:acyl-CoA synthetase (AMP-forming)/AMP-acid ligase II [Nocardia transvalensis]|uniref:Acyl-CoA synthetase (AMP-forming)/AMP-acid ligase II n=1 Tax=Nocardia transvalensis TaxID=37333 RepID=A0A7W9ULF8_9NOCA|nr:condensation domain-containing protein [Nocardia transvalensis]MBB5917327.1 acyl-CoA synthetase (AMP-forming)/AMP-acid ligase II [Nocardia transvalensis]
MATENPNPPNLTTVLRRRAEAHPDRLALSFIRDAAHAWPDSAEAITYSALDRRARVIAAALTEAAEPGARMVLLYAPGPEYVAAFFGCLYAGMVAVPAYPPTADSRADRLLAVIDDAGAAAYLTSSDSADLCRTWLAGAGGRPHLPPIVTDILPNAPATDLPGAEGDRLAFLQYTSGSTGDPKGVMLTHANLLANAVAINAGLAIDDGDRQVSWLPPYHDMGLIAGILQPIYSGIETVLMAPATFLRDPICWLEAIDRFGGTYSGAPNFALDLCVRQANPGRLTGLDLSRVRTMYSGAEPVRPATLERFADRFAANGFRPTAFMPAYGLAESGLVVTLRTRGTGAGPATNVAAVERNTPSAYTTNGALVSVGEPVRECVVRIVDPDTTVAQPDDTVGEIWTSNPGVALGYWGRPEISAEIFRVRIRGGDPAVRFLRTGDLGFLRDGQLYVTGRMKDVIIIRGENHYPQDLEETVWCTDPRLRAGCTAAFTAPFVPGGDERERLVVVQEISGSVSAAEAAEITRATRKRVAMVHGVPLDELVLIPPRGILKTSSGKIRRRATRQAFLDGALAGAVVAAPDAPAVPEATPSASGVRERLLGALRTVLTLPALGAHDDFFEWGGDSLLAVEAAAVAAEAGIGFDARLLYTHPSAALLATELERGGTALEPEGLYSAARGHIPRVPDADDYPVSPIQRRWAADYLGDFTKTWGNMLFDVPLADGGDRERLARAIDRVWSDHEALRTVFDIRDGEFRQRIQPQVPVPLGESDLRDLTDQELGRRLDTIRTELGSATLDVVDGPLTRFHLVHTARGDIALGVIHHMIVDGWSMLILRRELAETYRVLCRGEDPPPRPLDRYRDYAVWMYELERSGGLDTARDYWQRKLSEPLPDTLPVDQTAVRGPDNRTASVTVRVPDDAAAAVARLAQASRISTAVLLNTVFFTVLHRHTGGDDLIVYTPLAGRDRADIRDAIGMFINNVPMRMRFHSRPDFRTVAHDLQQQLVESVIHQRWQLDRMAQDLGLPRDPDQFPISNTFFSTLDIDDPLPPATVEAHTPTARMLFTDTRFHLMFYAYEHPNGLRLECKYRQVLFEETEVVGLVRDFLHTLDDLATMGLDIPIEWVSAGQP